MWWRSKEDSTGRVEWVESDLYRSHRATTSYVVVGLETEAPTIRHKIELEVAELKMLRLLWE